MIKDSLNNAAYYFKDDPKFQKAFDFIRNNDIASLAPGRHEIDGDAVYALVVDNTLASPEEGRMEAHQKYADIQYIAHGSESIYYAPLDALTLATAYNAEKDIAFYKEKGESMLLRAGDFAVYLPQDGHMPGILPAGVGAASTRKTIVKIRLS